MKKNLVSLKSPMFGELSTREMKNITGGEIGSQATNGRANNVPCPDRERIHYYLDKNGQMVITQTDCTEYFIDGAWR